MPPYKGRTCVVCSRTFDASYPAQRTCGRTCGALINTAYAERRQARTNWPRSKLTYADCPECQRVFAKHHGRTFCSTGCRHTVSVRLRRATKAWGNPKKPRHPQPCPGCGGQAVVWPRQRCDTCIAATRKARKTRDKRRRRALKLGVSTEPYTLAEIAERDRYRCGLCRRKVPMHHQVPHPLAPTVDHVVPLSQRGDDTRANVQLAHFICNSTKGAGGGQQLALVG